jgi:hypothetical protein
MAAFTKESTSGFELGPGRDIRTFHGAPGSTELGTPGDGAAQAFLSRAALLARRARTGAILRPLRGCSSVG